MTTDVSKVLSRNVQEALDITARLTSMSATLEQAAEIIVTALRNKRKILTCGNGGSAADAAHLATEFVSRYCTDREPHAAISLVDVGSTLTAIGNDYAFEEVFARQVRGLGNAGDVLVAFTTSGRSRNIALAITQAKSAGLATIAFLGRDGGDIRGTADVELLIPGTSGTGRIQEAHQVLYHTLCEIIDSELGTS